MAYTHIFGFTSSIGIWTSYNYDSQRFSEFCNKSSRFPWSRWPVFKTIQVCMLYPDFNTSLARNSQLGFNTSLAHNLLLVGQYLLSGLQFVTNSHFSLILIFTFYIWIPTFEWFAFPILASKNNGLTFTFWFSSM